MKEYLGKDYLGESLYIGDEVVFMQVGYRNFTRGVLISGGKTGGTIEYIKDGSNLPSKAKQYYTQMIKCIRCEAEG